jgi:Holliday junction resolvasome RuvABC endonuclease subunit
MNMYVGIDPSINSTGIVIQIFDENIKIKEHFYIIKPDKLTKKEQIAQGKYIFFDYILYTKLDLKNENDNNHISELHKTLNMIKIVDNIYNLIYDHINEYNVEYAIIVQEGISYGSSIRTKSVFDLAGLNYMIRYKLLKLLNNNDNLQLIIGTPSEIKKWVTGSGNCNKEIMIEMFKSIYSDFDIPKVDDISDAYFMSLYAKKIFENNI